MIIRCVLVALLIDASMVLLQSDLSVQSFAWVVAASGSWAIIVLLIAVVPLFFLFRIANFVREEKRWPYLFTVAIPALPFSIVLYVLTTDLLSGQGFALKSWAKWAQGAVAVACVLGPILFLGAVTRINSRFLQTPKKFVFYLETALCLTLMGGFSYLDARVYPHIYRSAHLLIWLGIFGLVAIWSGRCDLKALRPWNTFGEVKRVSFLALVALLVLMSDPLAREDVRASAWRDTLFLKRALLHVVPSRVHEVEPVDTEVLKALSQFEDLASQDLDSLFPHRGRTNVVLVSIDALRADRLGIAHYRRRLTPNLDSLIRRSAYFSETWTCCPATLPSFSATMRGRNWVATDTLAVREGRLKPNSARDSVLPEILHSMGYQTEAVLGVRYPFVVKSLSRGFQRFNVEGIRDLQSAERVTDFGLSALDQKRSGPIFLWIHYFDPHAPYAGYGEEEFGASSQDQYDAEVAYVDREFGRFLQGLSARGLRENTMIVVMADHGEEWDDRGVPMHGLNVHESQIHIPLVFHIPGVGPQKVQSAVSNIDIMPTVLEFVGGDRPKSIQGRSLLRYVLLGEPSVEARKGYPEPVAFSESFEGTRKVATRQGNRKLTWDVQADLFALEEIEVEGRRRVLPLSKADHSFQDLKKLLNAYNQKP